MPEMMYLMEKPLVLDGTKYELEVGAIPHTSFEDGIIETLQALIRTEKVRSLQEMNV
jgi:hypothetical protein